MASNDDVDTDFSEYEAPEEEEILVEEEAFITGQAVTNGQVEQEVPISIAAHRNVRSDEAAMADKDNDLDSYDGM